MSRLRHHVRGDEFTSSSSEANVRRSVSFVTFCIGGLRVTRCNSVSRSRCSSAVTELLCGRTQSQRVPAPTEGGRQ